ncbi:MAG: DUF2304 domain-containing protein [Anaerolineae bacterium]|nr:DUF2304 domain-containing protein [Anaerolineae bacterium]
MPIRQMIVALLVSLGLLIFIVEMVRRRRLREEYALLWLITAAGILILTLRFNWLMWLTRFIGADEPMSTLFFLGVLFSMFISLHYSTRISQLNEQVKDLTQALAITQARLEAAKAHEIGEER